MSDNNTMETTTETCDLSLSGRKSHHSEKTKADLVARLNRAEGQIRGITKMINSDCYCDDVLNQIAAVQSAVGRVGKILLEAHIKSCITERIKEDDPEVIDELMTTISRFSK